MKYTNPVRAVNLDTIHAALDPVKIIQWLRTQPSTRSRPSVSHMNMFSQYLVAMFPSHFFIVFPATIYYHERGSALSERFPNPPIIERVLRKLMDTEMELDAPIGTGLYITQLVQALQIENAQQPDIGMPERVSSVFRQEGFDDFHHYYINESTAPRSQNNMDATPEQAREWMTGWNQAQRAFEMRHAAYGDVYRTMTKTQLADLATAEIAVRS